jgi:phage baseplate assembly protein gpV
MGFAVPRSNRQTSGVGDYELTDTARNIGSLLRFGTIHSVNYEARLCRVQLNNNVVTDEIPWITITAGGSVFWNAPSVEETVLLLSPSGELNNSVCLPALQRNPSGTWPFKFSDLEFEWGGLGEPRTALWRWLFADGAILENDAELNQFRVEQNQTRLMGREILHGKSKKYIYIECDEEDDSGDPVGVVHIKSPMIKLEGDVQITGQLLQGGRIVGTEPSGNGLKELVLVGDPIKLNGSGGVLGIASSLVGTLAGGGFSLGTLGASLSNFGNIGQSLGGLSGILGQSGMGSLISSLPISGIGSALEVTGTLPVLGELMNGLGFAGSFLEDATGAANLVLGITSGSGLDLTSSFTGLTSVSNALNSAFPNAGLSGLTDLTALGGIATSITSGNLTINDVMSVVDGTMAVTGFTPPAGVSSALNIALAATDVITDEDGNIVQGPQLLDNAADTVMTGLRGASNNLTDDQIADKIIEQGLATVYEGLREGDVDGGALIGSFIQNGDVTLEQVLDMGGVFVGAADASAQQAGSSEPAAEQEFFEHFDRARPGEFAQRDTTDRAMSGTDPRVTQSPNKWGDLDFTFT